MSLNMLSYDLGLHHHYEAGACIHCGCDDHDQAANEVCPVQDRELFSYTTQSTDYEETP